jgi:hypothetical protein
MLKDNIKTAMIAAVVSVSLGATTATAASLITSSQIKDGTITSADIHRNTVESGDIKNGAVHLTDLSKSTQRLVQTKSTGHTGATGAQGPKGDKGATGPQGPKGDSMLYKAYWAVAYYDVGDTNAGAIATVACADEGDSAVSGGVQTLGLDADANSRNTPVSSSLAGRMDWSTGKPNPGRKDGWIVQFGGNAGATSDKAPEKVKVYALCVPGHLETIETYVQSDN